MGILQTVSWIKSILYANTLFFTFGIIGKCRKRWARLQQKYQQTLSSALQDATDCSLLEAADPDADPEFDPDVDTNNFESLEPPGGLFSHIHNVAENDEDDMELYRDLQEIRGELDL